MSVKDELLERLDGVKRSVVETGNRIKDRLGIGTKTYLTTEICEDILEEEEEEFDIGLVVNGEYLPSIKYDSPVTIIALGQWMNILDNVKVRGIANFMQIHEPLSALELSSNTEISNSELLFVSREFAKLLLQAGISSDEVVSISDFNEEKGTFNCSLEKADKTIEMSYSYGNLDDFPALVFKEGEDITNYDFLDAYEDRPRGLRLAHYTRTNPETGVKYWFYNTEFFFSCNVIDGDYEISMHFDYPEHLDDLRVNPYVDINKMRDVFLGVRLPQNALDTFSIVNSCLLTNYRLFPKFEIKEVKKEIIPTTGYKKVKEIVTNSVLLCKGQKKQVVVTKDGKTITINDDNSWVNSSDDKTIALSSQGQVSYNAISILMDNLSLVSPATDYEEALKEVEDVRRLTLTTLPEDNMVQE